MSNKTPHKQKIKLSKPLLLLLAVTCGITVANLYYVQPLLAQIAQSFKMSQSNAGIVTMLTQIGYALGLLLFVPLGDIRERRSLITTMMFLVAVFLLTMAVSFNKIILMFSAFAVGFITIVPQLIVPFAAHLAEPEERGKTLGFIFSGLLIGILLSRTFSGIIGGFWGWRTVYYIAAAVMIIFALLLRKFLPKSPPTSQIEYKKLLISLFDIIKSEPVLREASISGALLFAAFSVFWNTLIFLLESPVYNSGTQAAGLFGLVGITGALAAPLVGRLADKKSPKFVVGIGTIISGISYICFWLFGSKIAGLIVGVILLDLGTQTGQVSNQARIQALSDEKRSRINTIFMVSYFVGGSVGSFLGAYSWGLFGWAGVSGVGLLLILTAVFVHFVIFF